VDLNASFRPIERQSRRALHVLFVGQVSWYKGLHYLLDAFEGLRSNDVLLTVIGMVHPEWLPYFEKRFRRMSNVRYLGSVAHGELLRYYAEADVFAFPSLGGGVGLSVYEAMATGLPVITSDGDVVIRDGVDGMVVDARETGRWVEALISLRDNLNLRQRLGRNAADRVRYFSWDAYRRGIVQAYREIAEREHLLSRSPAGRRA
jgi:glycosyltransferase involved in cell wall biosynthesis